MKTYCITKYFNIPCNCNSHIRFLLRSKVLSVVVLSSLGVIYSIPSLALFALLIPILGLGKGTAIFVLVIYDQYILVRKPG